VRQSRSIAFCIFSKKTNLDNRNFVYDAKKAAFAYFTQYDRIAESNKNCLRFGVINTKSEKISLYNRQKAVVM